MKFRNGLQTIGKLMAQRPKQDFGLRGEEGSSLVEFALTLPMLFGLIYLGATLTLGMYNLQQLGNAASATVMAVGGDVGLYPNNDPCTFANGVMKSSLPNWTPANLSYSLIVSNASGVESTPYTGTGTSFSCPLGSETLGPNYPVIFSASYKYSWLGIPALPFFNTGLSKPTGTLSTPPEAAVQM
jgi:Flp pilus assembly protein TadG